MSKESEVQAACKRAREKAKEKGEDHVVYYDVDYQKYKAVALSTWEMWIDQNQVDDYDLHSIYRAS